MRKILFFRYEIVRYEVNKPPHSQANQKYLSIGYEPTILQFEEHRIYFMCSFGHGVQRMLAFLHCKGTVFQIIFLDQCAAH